MEARFKVLITGAAGDLGQKVAAHLRTRPDVELVLLDRDPRGLPDVHQVDLAGTDGRWPALFQGMHAVLHLAADPRPDAPWQSLQRENLDALIEVLEASVAASVRRFVFASSNFVMAGYRETGERLTPQLPEHPATAYGFSKAAGERFCASYARRHGLSVVCLRIGVVVRGAAGPESIRDAWYRAMWLSERDLCQVTERALRTPDIGFVVLNAMSDNHPTRWDLSDTRAVLGYVPEDGYRPGPVGRSRGLGQEAIARARRVLRRVRH